MTSDPINLVFGRDRVRMLTGPQVEVFRESAEPGASRRYTKRFLATPEGDYGEWTEREWRILARLIGHGARCVPDVVQFDRDTRGPTLVQTYDAGATVEQWATLLPVERNGRVHVHVFEDCAHWWALAQHCLLALAEIHALGLVHLDVKGDNVCIPVGPGSFDPADPAARLFPVFGKLALIDFAFSLASGEALATPLPIGWQRDYDYQSPRLLQALEQGRAGDLRPTRMLDWRCDFYSLAAMLKRYLPDELRLEALDSRDGWTPERYHAAKMLVLDLREVHDGALPAKLPHAQLAENAATWLGDAELAASLDIGWRLAREALPAVASLPLTPITRIAPPIRFTQGRADAHRIPPIVVTARARSDNPRRSSRPPRWAPPLLVAGAALFVFAMTQLFADGGDALRASLRGVAERARMLAAPASGDDEASRSTAAPAIDPAPAASPAPEPLEVPRESPPEPPVTTGTDANDGIATPSAAVGAVPSSSVAKPEANAPRATRSRAPAKSAQETLPEPRARNARAKSSAPKPPASRSPATTTSRNAAAAKSAPPRATSAGVPARAAASGTAPSPAATVGTPARTETTVERPAAPPEPTSNLVPPPASAAATAPPAPTGGPGAQPAMVAAPDPAVSSPMRTMASAPPDAASEPRPAERAPSPVIIPGAPGRAPIVDLSHPRGSVPAPVSRFTPPAEPAREPPPVVATLPTADRYLDQARWALAVIVPQSAARARVQIAPVLSRAADARHPAHDRSIAALASQAAGGRRIDAGERRYDPPEARRLHEEAARQFRLRRDYRDALALELRAFGANPHDADVAGQLAVLYLRAQPAQPELARLLVLHAMDLRTSEAGGARSEDWITLAVASALTERALDATYALYVALALSGSPERTCQSAKSALATHGERLREPVETLLARLQAQGRSDGPQCGWPVGRVVEWRER